MKKKLTFILILFISNLEARPIIDKYINGCRTNLWGKVKCNKVHQQLTSYPCPTTAEPERRCEGWSLLCEGRGTSECLIDPNSGLVYNQDAIDEYWGEVLQNHAIEKIETQNVLSGNHSETILLPDGTYRVYTVVWSISKNDEGEIFGQINVSCSI